MRRTMTITFDDEAKTMEVVDFSGGLWRLQNASVTEERPAVIDVAAEDAAMDGRRHWKPGPKVTFTVSGIVE